MPITILQKGKQKKKLGKLKKEMALGMPKEKGRTMGINVSTSMGFENQNFLRNTARQILQRSGANEEASESIMKTVVSDYGMRPETSILGSSVQITLNNSLKETLRYLNAHAKDKRKKYVLGELWNKLEEHENLYHGELIDFEVDFNLKNIFAA